MAVTLSGMATLSKALQLVKTRSPSVVTLSGRTMLFRLLQLAKTPSPRVMMPRGRVSSSSPVQYTKALSSIREILLPKTTSFRLLQTENADLGMTVSPSPRIIFSRETQLLKK